MLSHRVLVSLQALCLLKKLDDIYGDDASIYIFLSHEDIKYFFEDLEISDNGVYAIMEIDTYGDAYGDEDLSFQFKPKIVGLAEPPFFFYFLAKSLKISRFRDIINGLVLLLFKG